ARDGGPGSRGAARRLPSCPCSRCGPGGRTRGARRSRSRSRRRCSARPASGRGSRRAAWVRRSRSSDGRSYSSLERTQGATALLRQRDRPAGAGEGVALALLAGQFGELRALTGGDGRGRLFAQVDLVSVPAELPRDDDPHDAREVLGGANADDRLAERTSDPRDPARELARVEDGDGEVWVGRRRGWLRRAERGVRVCPGRVGDGG